MDINYPIGKKKSKINISRQIKKPGFVRPVLSFVYSTLGLCPPGKNSMMDTIQTNFGKPENLFGFYL
jgi:hypothetical protein